MHILVMNVQIVNAFMRVIEEVSLCNILEVYQIPFLNFRENGIFSKKNVFECNVYFEYAYFGNQYSNCKCDL